MNQEPENEMDLLLRKLGRLNNTSRPESEEADSHLDPDELNAYAEKALPAAAHARYTEHLADCSRCRTLVSQLSVAAGVVIEEKAPSVVPKTSGLKAFLASLFSPMVMRYAVPAMGLVIVASIGFMVFRQSENVKFLRLKSAGSVAEQTEQQRSAGLNNTVAKDTQANNTPSQEVAQNKAGGTTREATPKDQPAAPADDSRAGSKDAKSDQPVTNTDQVAGAPASVAGRVDVAAASPKPTATTVQNEPERRSVQAPPAPAETVTVAKSNEKESKAPAKVADSIDGFGAARGPAKAKNDTAGRAQVEAGRDEEAKKREREDKDEATKQRERQDKAEPDTKTVAGRRFRKDGSVWVDVAYSSQATTNVTRGSEQYRALVADEPGIKTIADQLGGEVIVVWKGRAYKIR